jgi:hypothetical protein
VIKQTLQLPCRPFRVVGRDMYAGPAVDHRVDQTADRGSDHRHTARHRLERSDPEGLIPGNAHKCIR